MPPIDPSRLPPNALAPQGIQPQPFPGALQTVNAPGLIPNVRNEKTGQDTAQEAQLFPYKARIMKAQAAKAEEEQKNLGFNSGEALGDPKLTGDARLATVPPAQRGLVELALHNQYSQLSSFALGRPQWQSILNTAKEIDPNFDPSLMKPRSEALSAFTGAGKAATTIGAINRLALSMQRLKQASDAMHNPNLGQAQLNAITAAIGQSIGKKNVTLATAYDTLLPEVTNQADRIMKAVGAPTVTGNAEIAKGLTRHASTDQRDAAFTALAGMLHSAIQPLKDQWDSAYGGNKAPPMWISKNASDFLSSIDKDDAGDFGGEDYRGLPGLKGDGSVDQATMLGGHPASYYDPNHTPAFMFPKTDNGTLTIDPDQKPIKMPQGYIDAHTAFLEAHPPGTLTAQDYIDFRNQKDKEYSIAGMPVLHSDLSPDKVKAFVDSYNHGLTSPTAPIPTDTIPTNLAEKAMISAGGVGLAKAANAATLGIPSLLAGQEGRDAMEVASNAHPNAAFIGDVAGSILPIAGLTGAAERGLENLAGKEFLNTTRGKLAANALGMGGYSAARGFNEANTGEGLTDAAEGAAVGPIAAVGGNLIAKGVTPFMSAATQDALKTLGPDVKLTLPQMLGQGHTEEMFRAVPFSRGAQAKAAASWNKSNINDVLSGLPSDLVNSAGIEPAVPNSVNAGTGKIQFLNTQLNKGYDTIKPRIGGTIDQPFIDNVNALLPPSGDPIVQNLQERANTALSHLYADPESGTFNGDSYVKAQGALRGLANNLAKTAEGDSIHNTTARELLDRVKGIQNEVTNLVGRNMEANGEPELFPQLQGLEKGWAQKMQLEDATTRAVPQNGGVYSPAQRLQSIKKFDPSGNNTLFASGEAFGEPETLDAQKIMGSSPVPEKPFLRDTTYAGVGSLGTLGLLPMAGAAAYTPGVKQLVAAALLKRYPGIWSKMIPNQVGNLLDTVQPVTQGSSDAIRNFLMGQQ